MSVEGVVLEILTHQDRGRGWFGNPIFGDVLCRRPLIKRNTTSDELGGELASWIMSFNCFSGCDSMIAFFKKSKNVLFKAWNSNPIRTILSEVFKTPSFCPSLATIDSSLSAINEFIAYFYTDELEQLNTARFNLYIRCTKFRESPPLEPALN